MPLAAVGIAEAILGIVTAVVRGELTSVVDVVFLQHSSVIEVASRASGGNV